MKHKKSSKSEKQYVRGIVHNLSLQRLTDQEIVDYLHDEKKIDIARTTVNGIKNQVEKQAEKWYIELKQSRYKYIATYKERLDSLMSYQRKLNEIIEFYRHEHLYPDTVIRAISELHRIEISIFNLWKQLPNLDIVDNKNNNDNSSDGISQTSRAVAICYCHDIVGHYKCKYCLHVWCPKDKTEEQNWCPNTNCEHSIKGCRFQPYDEKYTWIKCPTCERWFKTQEILNAHPCIIV